MPHSVNEVQCTSREVNLNGALNCQAQTQSMTITDSNAQHSTSLEERKGSCNELLATDESTVVIICTIFSNTRVLYIAHTACLYISYHSQHKYPVVKSSFKIQQKISHFPSVGMLSTRSHPPIHSVRLGFQTFLHVGSLKASFHIRSKTCL
jgi:hypothetical protein